MYKKKGMNSLFKILSVNFHRGAKSSSISMPYTATDIQMPTIIALINCDGSVKNSDKILAFFECCFFFNSIDNLLRETKPTSMPAKKPPSRNAMIIPINKSVPMIANI